MANLELVALVVRDYDLAIRFFVNVLEFELVEDTPSLTNNGWPKRWFVEAGRNVVIGARLKKAGIHCTVGGANAITALAPFQTQRAI